MDIELSSEDLEFEKEVRAFLSENAYKPGEDPNAWRMGWFEKGRCAFQTFISLSDFQTFQDSDSETFRLSDSPSLRLS